MAAADFCTVTPRVSTRRAVTQMMMLPYLLSIAALVLVARRAAYPQALMKPYRKGER